MEKKKKILIAAAVLAVVAIVIGAILKNRDTGETITEISWTQVSSKKLEETVSGSGDFMSRSRTTIQSSISGRVEEVLIADGQEVSAGDLLLTLDDTLYRNALDQARVAYESALRRSQEEYLGLRQTHIQARDAEVRARDLEERTRESFDHGSVSKEEWQQSADALQQAEMSAESARQRVNLALGRPLDDIPPEDLEPYRNAVTGSPDVRGARLSVQAAEEELGHCRITAPESGFITSFDLHPGDSVTPDAPLFRIESLDEMIAEISIDEVDIGKIAVGDPALITSDSLVGRSLGGEVMSIAPVVERIGNLRAAVVKVSINQEKLPLRAGASCLVKIEVTGEDNEVVIPVTAFFSHTGALWVYRIDEEEKEGGQVVNVLRKREIELGRSSMDEVVVLTGLSSGDRVVTGNLSPLRDGLEVQLAGGEEDNS